MALRMFGLRVGSRLGGCGRYPCEHRSHTTVWDQGTATMWYITENGWTSHPFAMTQSTLNRWLKDNDVWKEVTIIDPELELDEGI